MKTLTTFVLLIAGLDLTGCAGGFSAGSLGVSLEASSSQPVSSPAVTQPSTPVTTSTPVVSNPPAPAAFTGMALAQAKYVAYGDSITGGFGASAPAAWYVNLLTADMGATLTNLARAGQLTCNIATMEVFANHVLQSSDGSNYVTLMEGTNDAYTEEPAAYASNFNNCQQASLTWLSIPYANKAIAQGSSCVKTGNWQQNYYEADELNSSEQGDTMACSLATTGGPLYFWYRVEDTWQGSFTYSVDGGAPVAMNSFSAVSMANSNNTEPTGVFYVRLPGLAAGTHTVKFVVTSPTGASNVVDLWGIGTTPAAGATNVAPHVFVSGVVYENTDARSTETSGFNAYALANAQAIAADGLPVSFVDLRSHFHGTASEMADQLHPNDLGHSEVKAAFEAAIQGR